MRVNVPVAMYPLDKTVCRFTQCCAFFHIKWRKIENHTIQSITMMTSLNIGTVLSLLASKRPWLTVIHRHVILPQSLVDKVPKTKLMTEQEWRDLGMSLFYDGHHRCTDVDAVGIRQSRGWVHYYLHKPEPHVLLFRRPLPPKENTNPNTR